ncbi:hypothetical protein [Streptomyces sp. NBC_00690]|uniref:hypothetical protein n=1 Tax=Streptomyces sp. NBC_00690 TaxID=2975808 RepID=UPI002E29B24A|nr:hypothetical protein [Streptomyces sp. NBC_00690]
MGIESDQLVYDYLSRVGDLAQQRQLSSGARMQLVTSLRGEIDRQRARALGDGPASVRRILGRLGTPDEVVNRVGSGDPSPSETPEPLAPQQAAPPLEAEEPPAAAAPAASPIEPEKPARRRIPRPRNWLTKSDVVAPEPVPDPLFPDGGLPPYEAEPGEFGYVDPGPDVDWWRIESTPFGVGEQVPGFTGGVEIPEILKPPPEEEEAGATEEDEAAEAEARKGWLRWVPVPRSLAKLRRRPVAAVVEPAAGAAGLATGPRFGSPLLLVAAVALLGGALAGSLLALGLGWLLVWASRKLTTAQKKVAVFVLPGAALTSGLVWLWGRSAGRWGGAVPPDGMRDAMVETWPWMLKGAAIASALYLVWRARKVVE